MPVHRYTLGSVSHLQQLYPAPELADSNLNFKCYEDVIRHYTCSSLTADTIIQFTGVVVTQEADDYLVAIEYNEYSTPQGAVIAFGERHAKIFNRDHAMKAIKGMELLKELKVWNP